MSLHLLTTLRTLLVLVIIAIMLLVCSFDLRLSSSGNGYCVEPASIEGQYDPSAPGYIVVFHEGVVAANEVNRLITVHSMRVGSIFATLPGFFAEMSNITLEQLRCESSIQYIEYNGTVTSIS